MTIHRIHPSGGVVISDLALGIAAEHLVCADLMLSGYTAFRADQTCAYDVVVEFNGRLIRIQVKATRMTKAVPYRPNQRPAYMWFVRRAGKAGRRVYGDGEFDLLALVATDIKRIAYLPPSVSLQTIHIRTHDDPGPIGNYKVCGKTFDQFDFVTAIRTIGAINDRH